MIIYYTDDYDIIFEFADDTAALMYLRNGLWKFNNLSKDEFEEFKADNGIDDE